MKYPLIKGGQGRVDQDVEEQANALLMFVVITIASFAGTIAGLLLFRVAGGQS